MPYPWDVTPELLFGIAKEKGIDPEAIRIYASGPSSGTVGTARRCSLWIQCYDYYQDAWYNYKLLASASNCDGSGFRRDRDTFVREMFPRFFQMFNCSLTTQGWATGCKDDPVLGPHPAFRPQLKDYCKDGANWGTTICQNYCKTAEGLVDPDCKTGYLAFSSQENRWLPPDLGGDQRAWDFTKAAGISLSSRWQSHCSGANMLNKPECMGENSYACSTTTAGVQEHVRGNRYAWCTRAVEGSCKTNGYKDPRCSCLKPWTADEEAFINQIGANGTRYCLTTPGDGGAGLTCKKSGYVQNVQEECQDICALVAKASKSGSITMHNTKVTCISGVPQYEPKPATSSSPGDKETAGGDLEGEAEDLKSGEGTQTGNSSGTADSGESDAQNDTKETKTTETEEDDDDIPFYTLFGIDFSQTGFYITIACCIVSVLSSILAAGVFAVKIT